jgi:ribA/ribD-fused uncharacterized protein
MKSSPSLPLTREDLVTALAKGLAPKWCLFWGHTPAKDGSISKSCFSQWWDGHPFEFESVTYRTAEHFMMAGKARLFGDEETLAKILACEHPAEAKKLGRLVRNFDESKWNAACWDIVVAGNHAKFSQHPDLREFLLTTGDRIIVEASPFDRIWGIGMAASNPNAENPVLWKGENLLGFALMAVREKLATPAPAP